MKQRPEAEAILERIDAVDDPAIFIDLPSADELAESLAADRHGPLAGHTFTVKDNIDVAGRMTTAALPGAAYRAERSAEVIDRLVEAGAVLVGKTNLDQLATGLVGVRSPYGAPRNPLDATRVPGGSSSGSAVAVARGLVSFALGTDTAGSGRVPAACCGIVGLKPAPGTWPTDGVFPASPSYDCVSVFAPTVLRAVAVAGALGAPWVAADGRFTVGVPADGYLGDLTPAVGRGFGETLSTVEHLGHHLADVDMGPFFEAGDLLYDGPLVAERTAAVGDRLAAGGDDVVDVVRQVVSTGQEYSAVDAFAALDRLAQLRHQVATVFTGIDLLVVPSVPGIPTLEEVAAEPVAANTRLGRFTTFVNLLGLAALTVPTGTVMEGEIRGSVTLIAPAGREGALVCLGAALSDETPERVAAPGGWVDLAVVGAHMSGQPLNRALTDRTARLVARTTTTPSYRLYHLAGGPPERPALERVSTGGRAIEVEVWRLTVAALGAITAEVSAPLAIGSVELASGETVKGFVCEPRGLTTAHNITAHGGWRAYQSS